MVRSGWSAEEVLFQRWQYVVWEKDVMAPGFGFRLRWLTCAALEQFPDNPWCMEPLLVIGSEEYWREVWEIAEAVYEGELAPAGCEGVTHYDNPAFWPDSDGVPPWGEYMELACCMGDHCFWRAR